MYCFERKFSCNQNNYHESSQGRETGRSNESIPVVLLEVVNRHDDSAVNSLQKEFDKLKKIANEIEELQQ